MAKCYWCPEGFNSVPDTYLIEHVKDFHPDTDAGEPEQWPDGTLIVTHETIEGFLV